MQFTPKSEEKLIAEATRKVFEPGIYDFTVEEAEAKISKTNKDMIELKLSLSNHMGEVGSIKDYLLESMGLKLRYACETCGLLDRYELGSLEPFDFIGRTGKVKIKIEKSKNPAYPEDRNAVDQYIRQNTNNQTIAGVDQNHPAFDPDVPF